MKIVELNEKEIMLTNGGAKSCSLNDHSCRNNNKGRSSGRSSSSDRGGRDCKRDWVGVTVGAGKAFLGGVGYAGTLFGSDGSKDRIDHIREATGGLAKSGWNQMGESFRCKKR